jgi:Cu/Ag efflux pump CusA
VAIKIFGPDLDTLRKLGTEVQTIAKSIRGFEDAKLDQQSTIPQLRIEANRDRATAYGVTPGELNDQLSTFIGGKTIAELREGQRAINLVIRLPLAWRDSAEKIAELPIKAGNGQIIPLSAVADVREAPFHCGD